MKSDWRKEAAKKREAARTLLMERVGRDKDLRQEQIQSLEGHWDYSTADESKQQKMTKQMSNNGLWGFLRARVKTLDFILSLVSNPGTILNKRVKSSFFFFFLFLKPYFIFCGENAPQEGKNGSREISAERSSRLSLEVGRSFAQKKMNAGHLVTYLFHNSVTTRAY